MTHRPWRRPVIVVLGLFIGAGVGGCSSLGSESGGSGNRTVQVISLALGSVLSLGQLAISLANWRATGKESADEARRSQEEIAKNLGALDESSTSPPSLETELNDLSRTLSATVERLHGVSERAQAFEAEVRGLVEKADAAKAAAALHEDDARKIAVVLNATSQARLTEDIRKLTDAHDRQMARIQRSGIRMTWVTFVAGGVFGFVINLASDWVSPRLFH
jgi:septal ring factor EnvC (AmiA/AmiB activator)